MKLHQKLFLLLAFLLPIQISRHFWPQWSYILGLRVDYLSPTVYLTDILVMGILGLWGLEKVKSQKLKVKNKIQNSKFLFFSLAVFVFLLVNCFFAKNQPAAFYKLIKIIEFSWLGFYVAKNYYSLFTIRYSLIGAVIYSSLIAIIQFLKQASLNGIFWWLGERTFNAGTPGIAKAVWSGQLIMRPYGTFPHPNVLAGFLLVSLALIQNTEGIKKVLQWTAMVLGAIAIAISFSRSVWLVGLLIGIWYMAYGLWRKDSFKCLTPKCLITFFILFLSFSVFQFFSFSVEKAFSQRLQLIKVAVLMIKDNPLTGVGLNNFIVRLPEFWQNLGFTYWLQPVHNIFLLIATETGIIGLLIFLWFLALTYKRLLITNYYLLITALSAILALGFFDHYWLTLQQTQLLLTIILGLAWAKK